MRRAVVLAILALALSSCLSEINKPIRPNDPWLKNADMMDQAVPRD
ncbi:hypothetical protein [Consotaella aegiceratis]